MKKTSYQFTDLPVIDAGDGERHSRGPRPLLWVLMTLLVASASVSVWVSWGAQQQEPEPIDPPVAVRPSAEEKEQLLGSLAESTSSATEDERLAALASLSIDVAVPVEEMQDALARFPEEAGE